MLVLFTLNLLIIFPLIIWRGVNHGSHLFFFCFMLTIYFILKWVLTKGICSVIL